VCANAAPNNSLTLVQVWCNSNDKLTLGFKDAVESAFKGSTEFTVSSGKRPGTLLIVPARLTGKPAGNRTHVRYSVEFASVDNRKFGTASGSCWDDAFNKCAAHILARAKVAARKMH
jgi:hypothetical protein